MTTCAQDAGGVIFIVGVSTVVATSLMSGGTSVLAATELARLSSMNSCDATFFSAITGTLGGVITGTTRSMCNAQENIPACFTASATGTASSLTSSVLALIIDGGCTATVKYLAASGATGIAIGTAGAAAVIVLYAAGRYLLVQQNDELKPLLALDGHSPSEPGITEKISATLNTFSSCIREAPEASSMNRDTPT